MEGTNEEPIQEPLEAQQKAKPKGLSIASIVFIVVVIVGAIATRNDKTSMNAPRQSSWDHSVDLVVDYLKHDYLRDPKSYESVKWGLLKQNEDGTFHVGHTFRARNSFGGMEEQILIFVISADGKAVIKVY
jgi:hypothetical protein